MTTHPAWTWLCAYAAIKGQEIEDLREELQDIYYALHPEAVKPKAGIDK